MTSLPRDIHDIDGLNSKYKAFLIRGESHVCVHRRLKPDNVNIIAADLTCVATILSLPVAAIQHRTKLSHSDVNSLLDVIIDSQLPPIKTVAEHFGYPSSSQYSSTDGLALQPECFSTGDEGFDSLLGGGIRLGKITEFVGTACVYFIHYFFH